MNDPDSLRGIAEGAGILVVPVLLANFLFDTGLTAFQRWRRGARLWEASGVPYPELISRLIDLALERR